MASTKLYAGVALRQIRQDFALTQKTFADRLEISLPYLSQMENNHRPIATSVVLALARDFNFDVSKLSDGDTPLVWDARSNMRTHWFMPMIWIRKTHGPLSLLAYRAGFASAKIVINARYPR